MDHDNNDLPVHPWFGRAAFINKHGNPVWLPIVAGGSEDHDGGDTGPDNDGADDDSTGGDGSTDDGGDDDGTSGDDDKSKPPAGDVAELKAELERVRSRMKAADRRATEAERKNKEFADKDKTELERAQSEAAEIKKQHDDAVAALRNTRLENAFYRDNSVSWNDPGDAFALLDMSNVEIDDDGKVHGMKEAIKSLASKKKYLVKAENDPSTEASGSSVNGRRKGEPNKPDRSALAKDFPALAHRR